MKCNNCKCEIPNNFRYCDKCGNRVSTLSKKIICLCIISVILFTVCICILANTGIINPIAYKMNLAYKYIQEGKYEEAILIYDKVIEIDVNNADARFGKSISYEYIGDYVNAKLVLDEILEIDNDNDVVKDRIKNINIKLYSSEDLNYTINEVDVDLDNYTYKGIVKCEYKGEVLWEKETKICIRTELESISEIYSDEKNIYYVAQGELTALDKYTGERVWSVDDVGASNSLVMDDKNIYVSGYYGPNYLVISKNGKELYRDNDNSYGWVYDLKLYENELLIYYDLPEEGSIKRINISQFQ